MNPDMPRQRDLSPDQQKYQRNAACPPSNTHTGILQQASTQHVFQLEQDL
jgi:hypothetical protein